MTATLLILRPQPGADETARRARERGLKPIVAPLFTIRPTPWAAPEAHSIDALLLTSANAARHGGEALAHFSELPCYAVGPGTAAAARAAGLSDIRTGPGDGAALALMMVADGVARALHLCGREHRVIAHPAIRIDRRIVYAADPEGALRLEAVAALRSSALVLLHSPRAAARFATLVGEAGLDRGSIAIAAISEATAAAAGFGWRTKVTASTPRDQALLELAAKLCQTGGIADTEPTG